MKSRIAFVILIFFSTTVVHAQPDSVVIKENLIRFENALIAKNYQDMQELLYDGVSFGHSTGWIQTKQEVINDCKSGKLLYKN